jgi:hypothetical protein
MLSLNRPEKNPTSSGIAGTDADPVIDDNKVAADDKSTKRSDGNGACSGASSFDSLSNSLTNSLPNTPSPILCLVLVAILHLLERDTDL